MPPALAWPLSVAAAIALAGTGCAAAPARPGAPAPGVQLERRALTDPRPNRASILRIDTEDRRVSLAVALGRDPDGGGPAEATLTDPFALADGGPVFAFINTNPWDALPDADGKRNRDWYAGQPVDIIGLAATNGFVQSPSDRSSFPVWIDARGRLTIGPVPSNQAPREGLAGWDQIVRDGASLPGPDANLAPRTAIGLDASGRTLWLVVVDGRQKGFSEGMSRRELADLMRDIGCWSAANLDGGGSSIMALAGPDGRLAVVNSPSDRTLGAVRVRPVPSILTVRTNGAAIDAAR